MKLTAKTLKAERQRLWEEQGKVCGMCLQPLELSQAVMDHNHNTGACRAACHAGCNSVEGVLTRAMTRYAVKNKDAFLTHIKGYLEWHQVDQTGLVYPSHKTAEEKKQAAKAKRKKKT